MRGIQARMEKLEQVAGSVAPCMAGFVVAKPEETDSEGIARMYGDNPPARLFILRGVAPTEGDAL